MIRSRLVRQVRYEKLLNSFMRNIVRKIPFGCTASMKDIIEMDTENVG